MRAMSEANKDALIVELAVALRRLLPVARTGNPTDAEMVAHWEYEGPLGNDDAAPALAALRALEKAEPFVTAAG